MFAKTRPPRRGRWKKAFRMHTWQTPHPLPRANSLSLYSHITQHVRVQATTPHSRQKCTASTEAPFNSRPHTSHSTAVSHSLARSTSAASISARAVRPRRRCAFASCSGKLTSAAGSARGDATPWGSAGSDEGRERFGFLCAEGERGPVRPPRARSRALRQAWAEALGACERTPGIRRARVTGSRARRARVRGSSDARGQREPGNALTLMNGDLGMPTLTLRTRNCSPERTTSHGLERRHMERVEPSY